MYLAGKPGRQFWGRGIIAEILGQECRHVAIQRNGRGEKLSGRDWLCPVTDDSREIWKQCFVA